MLGVGVRVNPSGAGGEGISFVLGKGGEGIREIEMHLFLSTQHLFHGIYGILSHSLSHSLLAPATKQTPPPKHQHQPPNREASTHARGAGADPQTLRAEEFAPGTGTPSPQAPTPTLTKPSPTRPSLSPMTPFTNKQAHQTTPRTQQANQERPPCIARRGERDPPRGARYR